MNALSRGRPTLQAHFSCYTGASDSLSLDNRATRANRAIHPDSSAISPSALGPGRNPIPVFNTAGLARQAVRPRFGPVYRIFTILRNLARFGSGMIPNSPDGTLYLAPRGPTSCAQCKRLHGHPGNPAHRVLPARLRWRDSRSGLPSRMGGPIRV